MLRVAIRGCGIKGCELKEIMRKREDIAVVAFIDKDPQKVGTLIDGVPVISIYSSYEKYRKEYDVIVMPAKYGSNLIESMIEELVINGISQEDIFVIPIESYNSEDVVLLNWDQTGQLPYLEFHVADHCNLNCSGCSHFCPLVTEKLPDIDKTIKDLQQLSNIVSHIEKIRILGGEPLLCSNIAEYVRQTKTIYPYSDIHIVTNGLLVTKLSEEVLNVIRENNVIIDVSAYPPLFKKMDEIMLFLKQNNIEFMIIDVERNEFHSTWNLESKEPKEKKKKECPHRCTNLRNGKITPCAVLAYADIFSEYYDKNLPLDGKIDIYEDELDVCELRKRMREAVPLCQYCDFSKKKLWKQAEKEPLIDEWLA